MLFEWNRCLVFLIVNLGNNKIDIHFNNQIHHNKVINHSLDNSQTSKCIIMTNHIINELIHDKNNKAFESIYSNNISL